MSTEIDTDLAKALLETQISDKLTGIPFDANRIRVGHFRLAGSILQGWSDSPVDLTREKRLPGYMPLTVIIEEVLRTERHGAWRGITFKLCPTERYELDSFFTVAIDGQSAPQFIYMPGVPPEIIKVKRKFLGIFPYNELSVMPVFEDLRPFASADYTPLNRIARYLRGPVATS